MKIVRASTQSVKSIGKQGEFGSTQVIFYRNTEFADWAVTLSVKRNHYEDEVQEDPYPVDLVENAGVLTWNVSLSDTAYVGPVLGELRYTNSTTGLYITETYTFSVEQGLGTPSETIPSGFEDWYNTIIAKAGEISTYVSQAKGYAEEAAASAEEAAEVKTYVDASKKAAAQSASEANTSASNAKVYKDSANTSANTASEAATSAAESAESASESAETASDAKTYIVDNYPTYGDMLYVKDGLLYLKNGGN